MDINESVAEILRAKSVLAEKFYGRFFHRHPEAEMFFEGVNMKRQAVLLTTALMVIQHYYDEPTPAIEQYLEYMGSKHSEMNIPEQMYPKWSDAMLDTLAEFHGDQWSEDLKTQWQAAISKTIETMLAGYEKHITI